MREPGAGIGHNPCGDECQTYEGPDAHITMPNGASYDLYESLPGQFTSMEYSVKGGFIGVVKVGAGVYDALMTDGGKASFTGTANAQHLFTGVATSIIDPYGQVTTLSYDASKQLVRVTEPGLRYLQINRDSAQKITSVQAFDGRGNLTQTVSYGYSTLNLPGTYGPSIYLTQVNYDDGAQATYTYQSPNVVDTQTASAPGLIKTCDDPRYAGPMKQIEYQFVTGTNNPQFTWGQLKAEKNFTTHQVVSQVTYPSYPGVNPPTDMGPYKRTETRGDGATRWFQYGEVGNRLLHRLHGFSRSRQPYSKRRGLYRRTE